MKLTVNERSLVSDLLPQKSSLKKMQLKRDIKNKLFSDEYKQQIGMLINESSKPMKIVEGKLVEETEENKNEKTLDVGHVYWDGTKDNVDLVLTDEELEFINELINERDQKGEITDIMLNIVEKIKGS